MKKLHHWIYIYIITIFFFNARVQSDLSGSSFSCSNLIISRTRWGARTPSEIDYLIVPTENIIIHHTVTVDCFSENQCSSLLTSIQNFHMDQLGFHDIGYNFLIGGDGQIYEGVGWHKIGAHTRGFNSRSLGVALIGNFTEKLPNNRQIRAAKKFLQCGVEIGEIDTRYKLFGARQVSATESPGLKLYQEMQKWEHFAKTPN